MTILESVFVGLVICNCTDTPTTFIRIDFDIILEFGFIANLGWIGEDHSSFIRNMLVICLVYVGYQFLESWCFNDYTLQHFTQSF